MMSINEIIKKLNQFKKKSFLFPVFFIILSFIFGAISQDIVDFTIVKPITESIKNRLNPPTASLVIDPLPYPMELPNGIHRIRVNLMNNGTKPLEDIRIDYIIPAVMNETKRDNLEQSTILYPSQRDYFEFDISGLNTSCSVAAGPAIIRIFKDTEGIKYYEFINFTGDVCTYAEFKMNITAKEFFLNYTYWYPYFEGSVSIGWVGGIPYEKAKNKSELVKIDEIKMYALDIITPCRRGDYSEERCRKNLKD